MKVLMENWQKFLNESEHDEDPDAGLLQPSEIPGELYHATQPTRFTSIHEGGITDRADDILSQSRMKTWCNQWRYYADCKPWSGE